MLSVTSRFYLEWFASSTGNKGMMCSRFFPIVAASPFQILNYVPARNSKLWGGSAVASAQILNYAFMVMYILVRRFGPRVSIPYPSLFICCFYCTVEGVTRVVGIGAAVVIILACTY